jgi:hypothetical protein
MFSDLLSLLQAILDTFAAGMQWVYLVVLCFVMASLWAVLFLAGWIGFTSLRFRGQHRVLCPENAMPATIQLHARSGAMPNMLNGAKGTVRSCSRWPERSGCEQQCLPYRAPLRRK